MLRFIFAYGFLICFKGYDRPNNIPDWSSDNRQNLNRTCFVGCSKFLPKQMRHDKQQSACYEKYVIIIQTYSAGMKMQTFSSGQKPSADQRTGSS